MSENFLSEFLLDPTRAEGRINHETRAFMAQMLEFDPEPNLEPENENEVCDPIAFRNTVQNLSPPSAATSLPTHSSAIISSLVSLTGRMLDDLESNLPRLLSLNPSRRDAIAHHLEKLAGISSRLPPTVPMTGHSPNHLDFNSVNSGRLNSSPGLLRWIEGPRTPAQNSALKAYFEEVALISLGQALLLKNWSDRGIRGWTESDLGRLNWALSTALKPYIPLDREGWQITRPGLYSWYNPSPRLQHDIWNTLETWSIPDDGPNILMSLLGPARRAQPENLETSGYDSRFFQYLWKHIHLMGWTDDNHLNSHMSGHSNVMKRNKIVFSPTLRDGAWVRMSSPGIQWIGLESSHFQLMIAELMQIWWGPTPPPLWCVGTGIEVHAKDQLAFALGSPKPSVLCRIAEMEACDAAFVLEEQTIRTQGKSPNAIRFKEQVETLPYFKKIRSSGTSLGALQTCVALSKLRPGGILIWAREEALGQKEGNEVLNYLLERSKLICEWDFSELEHSLPIASPLFPKHLYLFQRETSIESRLSHRPVRHSIQGQMRSHVELSLVLEDAFQSIQKPVPPRGQWTVLSHPSPTSQRDWLEKWPDPASHSQVRQLDELRMASLPLAHFTTIRLTPEGDPNRNGSWSIHFSLQECKRGFWLTNEYGNEGRRLVARPLPGPGQEVQGHGFLVLVPDENWVAPLSAYLMSEWVQKWLDHKTERKGDRWIVNEQVVKWIPVPKPLLQTLGVPNILNGSQELSTPLPPLPSEWERLTAEISHRPREVKEALSRLGQTESVQHIHCALFVRTARAMDYLQSGQMRLFSLVTPDGRIRWRELLNVLPKSECVSLSLHPKIRLTGTLPPHLPIGKIDRVKSPTPGILLATESGFTLHIGADVPIFINMIWEQLDGVSHPTWNELLQYLRLPRKTELAESTALDVLRSYGEQSARLKDLRDLLAMCQLF